MRVIGTGADCGLHPVSSAQSKRCQKKRRYTLLVAFLWSAAE